MAEQELVLERWDQQDETPTIGTGEGVIMITPPVSEDYWAYRVRLTDKQAVVGFPKFGTIGVGFAVEEDWNTNLPYRCKTEVIRKHIWHNRGKSIPKGKASKARVERAILMIQEAAVADRPGKGGIGDI